VTGHPSAATQIITAVVVLVPLLWHTVWGIARMARSRPAVGLGFFSNLRYIVQRLSAIGLLFFLGAHLWLAWMQPRFVEGRAEPFSDIAREMHHHAPTLVVYLLGTLAIAYHLANGLWSFCMGWGIGVGKTALDWIERLAFLLFFAFLALGWGAIFALYRAGA
jgi:succinate dehydrogenase / fumarate reductase cytochrome b subunit